MKDRYVLKYTDFLNESDYWLDTGIVSTKPKWWTNYKERELSDRMRIDDTKKYKVLKFIYKAGYAGVKYTDIVKYIVEDINKMGPYNYKKHGGYWATNLQGPGGGKGLLTSYCKKNENGKWVLNNRNLIDHFNDLNDRGDLDRRWADTAAEKKGMDDMDIQMYQEFGILDDILRDR